MSTLSTFEFELFTAAMFCLTAVTFWLAIYLPTTQKTRQLSLWSLLVLVGLVAVALGLVRAIRW